MVSAVIQRRRRSLNRGLGTALHLFLLMLLLTGCAPLQSISREPERQPLPDVQGLRVAVDASGALLLDVCESGSQQGALMLDLCETTSDDAVAMTVQGEAELAIVQTLPGISLKLDDGYGSAVLAHDSLVLVSHPESAVEELDAQSLSQLYSGHVLDWSQLGLGQGEPQVLVQCDPARAALWQQEALGGSAPGSQCLVMPDDRAVIDYVRGHVAAIGYCSASLARATEGVKIVKVDAIASSSQSFGGSSLETDLVLVAPSDLAGNGRALADWLLSAHSCQILDSCFAN